MGRTTQSLMEGSRRSGVCGTVAAMVVVAGWAAASTRGLGVLRGLQRRGARQPAFWASSAVARELGSAIRQGCSPRAWKRPKDVRSRRV